MSEKSNSLSPGWVRCQSKSRPDRYFMFNKKTGETNWCTDAVNRTPQRTVSAKDITKTPAQDRLKRLQSNLQKKKTNELITSKAKGCKLSKNFEPVQVDKEVKVVGAPGEDSLKESQSPSISPKSHSAGSPQNVAKNKEHKFVIPEKPVDSSISSGKVEKPTGSTTNPSSVESQCNTKKTALKRSSQEDLFEIGPLPRKILPNPGNKSINKFEKKSGCSPNKSKKNNKPSTATADTDSSLKRSDRLSKAIEYDVNDNEQHLREESKPSFVSKVKDFCNNLISRATKPKEQKYPPNTEKERAKNISVNSKPSFKPKKPDNKSSLRGILLEKEGGSITTQLSSFPQKLSSPIPVPKESANSRLQRLRNSLHLQQTNNSSTLNASGDSSSINVLSDNSSISSSTCSPSLSTFECEPMDWQPIIELSELVTSSPLSNIQSADSSGLSEHYDTVNENLLRLSAERKQTKQWKTNYFYFVVDTNVFIENITFVEELTTMKLCETVGTIIYVPYCVLQELDKLKVRSPSESIKTRSARAIKYLNKSFEEKHQRIQVQGAADETKHLIKVTSPDDSILNCCLQVKQNVNNVLLLTEDINLQNKAMCNDILVSTKSDLTSKHESLI